MVMKSFSNVDNNNNFLDKKLNDLFNNKKNGFFIELGANDGLKQSNTAFFEKYMNWTGIKEILKFDFVHVGNHSHSHDYLVDKSDAEFIAIRETIKELNCSKEDISTIFVKKVNHN